MTREQVLLDPTAERAAEQKPRIARPAALAGLTVGLLDINKPRGDEFLDRLEVLLAGRGLAVRRYRKERFSNVASDALRREIAEACDAVVEALAD
jgi:hypothetical protein